MGNGERCSDRASIGRGAAAWQAGVDGIYMFNCFTDSTLKFELGGGVVRTIGDPQLLARTENVYFGSYRGVGAASFGNFPLEGFQPVETLNPQAPRSVTYHEPATARIHLGSEVSREGSKLTLALRFAEKTAAGTILVSVNGNGLPQGDAAGDTLEYRVLPSQVKAGLNQVEVKRKTTGADLRWLDVSFRSKPANR